MKRNGKTWVINMGELKWTTAKDIETVLDDCILSYNDWKEIEEAHGVKVPSKMKDDIVNKLVFRQKLRLFK